MAITLQELAKNSDDKLVQGFISEVITDSYLLSALTFDDCISSTGTSDMVYAYKRVKTPMEAKFRALNEEPAKSKPEIERITTRIAILSDAWEMDRVARDAAPDLYETYLEESKNAIIRKFNSTVVGGDTETDANGFDGLDKALKGTATDFTSNVDLSVIDKSSALAFAEEMDNLFSALVRTPDVVMTSPSMKVKINAICRVLGLATTTPDSAGKQVSAWNGVRIEELRDGSLTGNAIYAACLGLNELHGVTLNGSNAIAVHLPDWNAPGAVKSGDAEFVCGLALKKTKAAGVLRPKGTAAASYSAPQPPAYSAPGAGGDN